MVIVWSSKPVCLRLQITVDEGSRATVNHEMIIHVSLVNNSHRAITLIESNPEHDFVFLVIGPQGKKVTLTEYGKRITDPTAPMFGVQFITLSTGEEKRYSVQLDRLYQLDAPGTYTVSATINVLTQSMLDKLKIPITPSNKVQFRRLEAANVKAGL